LSLGSLTELISSIILQVNQTVLEAYREQLVETPLVDWTDFIEESKTRLCVMDSDSVQTFLNRLFEKYGEGDVRLSKDLLRSGDQRYASLLH